MEKENKEQTKVSVVKKIRNCIFSVSSFATAFIFWIVNFFGLEVVMASGIAGSKFVTGTKKMVEDATSALLVIAPLVTIFVVGYFFLRKGASDEMDHKKWNTRISTAIVSGIGVVSASVIVKVIMAYYQ